MAEKNRAVTFLLATFIMAAALTLAEEKKHPPATIVPPAKFDSQSTPQATTIQSSTTHAPNTTTHAPNTTTHAPNTTTHAPNTTTHAPNTTTHAPNTTTHAPNTTTHAPNTTTHAPNTTTHAPNTTTHAPNTTTHAPNTTTHAPNTTTLAPNTTTTPVPGPTKATNLTQGNYTIVDGDHPCIVLKAAIQIHVNSSETQGTFIVQPGDTHVNGQCTGGKEGRMELSFNGGSIVLHFLKNETTKMVYANYVAVNLTYYFKSGVLTSFSMENKSVQIFSMEASHSYSCKLEKIYLGKGINLEFSQERLQAFDFGKDGLFGPVDLCKADQPNYSVAIAVGIVLIILIIIVVIAYLVSRRKRTDGYQTL